VRVVIVKAVNVGNKIGTQICLKYVKGIKFLQWDF